jgi:hypothetical protein
MDEELLAQILAAQQPQLSPAALLATQGGVSRTTLGQLTDPNILAGVGVASPEVIAAGLSQYLSSQRGQLATQAEKDYMDAMEQWRKDVAAAQRRYTLEPPKLYTEVRDRYASAPNGVQTALDQIESGNVNANQAIKSMTVPLTQEELVNAGVASDVAADQANIWSYKDVLAQQGYGQDQWERLTDDIRQFDNDASVYRRNLLEFEDEVASARRNLDAELTRIGRPPSAERFGQEFDTEAARLQYYKDIGLPGLALLPDPTTPYRITGEQVIKSKRAQAPSGMTTTEALYERELGRPAPRIGAPSLAARPTPRPAPTPSAEPYAGRAQLPAGQFVAAKPAPEPKKSYWDMSREERIRWALEKERERAGITAQAQAAGLARAGRTPFEDAMRQLYRYGVTEAGA